MCLESISALHSLCFFLASPFEYPISFNPCISFCFCNSLPSAPVTSNARRSPAPNTSPVSSRVAPTVLLPHSVTFFPGPPDADSRLPAVILYNTAKVSSLVIPRAISFPPELEMAPQRLGPSSNMPETKSGRRRRSSSIIYQEPPESIEHTSDQSALPNLNANWVNAKGECCYRP